jgi:hypothetical protein
MESSDEMESVDSDLRTERTFGTELFLFAGKALIVAILFVASALFVVSRIESKIDRFAEGMRAMSGPPFWKKVEEEIDRAADPKRSLSQDKKAEILQKLRAISAQWRPFATEAYAVLTSTEPAAAVQPVK